MNKATINICQNQIVGRLLSKFTLFMLLVTTLSASGVAFAGAESYAVNMAIQSIASFDGTKIHAILYTPAVDDNQKFPAVTIGNVWGMPSELFAAEAKNLASHGFVVLMYSVRGFPGSEGDINIGGEIDVKDLSSLIDWLQQNPLVDNDKIGAAGVSLGGGIALITAAHDTRIKAVVMMSGWADIERTLLDENNTSPGTWGDVLILLANLSAHMDDATKDLFTRLKKYEIPRPELHAWAYTRSPINYIDVYNQRQLPIYIQHGIDDNLFKFSQITDFYQKLHTPKKLDMDLGDHAAKTLPGVVGISKPVWGRTIGWLELYLKNDHSQEVLFSDHEYRGIVKNRINSPEYVAYDHQGPINQQTFKLSAPMGRFSGDMGFLPEDLSTDIAAKTIVSGKAFEAPTGIPVIGTYLEALTGIQPLAFRNLMHADKIAVFEKETENVDQIIQGVPTLDLTIEPSQSKVQLVAILYRVDHLGVGFPVSFGAVTLHNAVPGEPVHVTSKMSFASYHIEAGSHLLLAVDTYNPYFLEVAPGPYQINILFGQNYPATITVPYLDQP